MKTFNCFVACVIIIIVSMGASAETICCDGCADCNAKIQNAIYGDTVLLTVDIVNFDGSCIDFDGKDGIVFDGGGHVIDGDGDYNGRGVYLSSGSNANAVTNFTVTGFLNGIGISHSSYNIVNDVDCDDNINYGAYLYHSQYNILSNLTLRGSIPPGNGVFFDSSSDNTLNNSYIIDNWMYGVNIRSSDNLTIYNNYFDNNADDVYFSGTIYPCTWNISTVSGTNIFGGPSIGGNYWPDYYDEDGNGDGFGRSPHVVDWFTNNTDYLPLVEVSGGREMYIRNWNVTLHRGDVWEYLVTCRNESGFDVECGDLAWVSSNATVGTMDGANITCHAAGYTNVTVVGFDATDTITATIQFVECGDVDCDDAVTINDVVDTYLHVVSPSYQLCSGWAADVDGDSVITINDVVNIYLHVIDPNHVIECRG